MDIQEPLKVLIPMEVEPSATNFWKLDKNTNQLTGFFVELIHLLFNSMNLTYTIEHNTTNFKSYTDLGKVAKLSVSLSQSFFSLWCCLKAIWSPSWRCYHSKRQNQACWFLHSCTNFRCCHFYEECKHKWTQHVFFHATSFSYNMVSYFSSSYLR